MQAKLRSVWRSKSIAIYTASVTAWNYPYVFEHKNDELNMSCCHIWPTGGNIVQWENVLIPDPRTNSSCFLLFTSLEFAKWMLILIHLCLDYISFLWQLLTLGRGFVIANILFMGLDRESTYSSVLFFYFFN